MKDMLVRCLTEENNMLAMDEPSRLSSPWASMLATGIRYLRQHSQLLR